jgi:hypothetical protein
MKRSKLTEAQIAFVLRQAEGGTPIGDEAAAAARGRERKAEENRCRFVIRRKLWPGGVNRSSSNDLAGEHSMCLPALPVDRSTKLPLPSSRAGWPDRPHQGDRGDPRTLRISAHPWSAAS